MLVELDKKDIISLLKGVSPGFSVMNKIPRDLGSYIGGMCDRWEWNYIPEDTSYTEEYLYNIYLMCKKS